MRAHAIQHRFARWIYGLLFFCIYVYILQLGKHTLCGIFWNNRQFQFPKNNRCVTIDIVRRALPRNMLRNKRAAFPAHVHAYAVKMYSESTESDTGDSSKSSEPSSSTSSVAASLLDRLRCLVKSDLGRKRKIHANPPPPVGKKC